MQPLISIIIPTYNRSHLIGETLGTIQGQTYQNWECVVVDDGSNDYTEELMSYYCSTDPRIKFHHRPKHLPKGGNVCRNYGYKMSKGKYIQWFDSDDLMEKESLQVKLDTIKDHQCDFVIAKLINMFPDNRLEEQNYNRKNQKILFEDYLFRRINWMTPDPLVTRDVLEKFNLSFNEIMRSDQEYNFYSKMLACTVNGFYIDKVLTKRRMHNNSIQSGVNRDSKKYRKEIFKNWYLTFLDLEDKIDKKIMQSYLNQIMTIYFTAINQKVIPQRSLSFFKTVLFYKKPLFFIYFLTANFINIFTNKGYCLLVRSRR